MSFRDEHPDWARERFEQSQDERALADARRDRVADHTPACSLHTERTPRITTAMTLLAQAVIEEPSAEPLGPARALAEMVLKAAGEAG